MVSVTGKHSGISSKERLEPNSWLEAISAEKSAQDMSLIRRACDWIVGAQATSQRLPDEASLQHALAVANILVDLQSDAETIAAALLCNAGMETPAALPEIEKEFGSAIARLVRGVSKVGAIQFFRAGGDKEGARKMLLAMAQDVRVILILLANRLHDMRTLAALPDDEARRRIAQETMDIYAPLASRLGIWQIKWELEDQAFRYVQPEDYKRIARMVNERRTDREHYIAEMVHLLSSELAKAGINAEVHGRPKHIYSIWRKMQHKDIDYTKIYDVRAVRVFVPEIRDCYAALGVVHSRWPYIPGEFDDYIAKPKRNNYQSIHTAITGPEGKVVEVQIRTREMHKDAELGVAAHWRYKEGGQFDQNLENKIALLRQLFEWQKDVSTGDDVHHQPGGGFEDRIYVFSPKGEIIGLPQGSTPLDFAYHIHTELGHRCRGAKVDGHMVPLTSSLKTGQRIEILTTKKGEPSRDWLSPHLGYLRSARARGKVQQWFRQQHTDAAIAEGRSAIERELQRLGLAGANYETLATRCGYDGTDAFFAAAGRGEVKPSHIAQAMHGVLEPPPRETEESPPQTSAASRQKKGGSGIEILGVGNLLTHFARCCAPVMGDEITGYITRHRGVTLHRRDCPNALRLGNDAPQRVVAVEWGNSADVYPVDIRIHAIDRQGLLRDITAILSHEKINVIAVNTLSNKADHTCDMTITLEIPDIKVLSRVLTRISQLPNVTEAARLTQ